MKKKNHKQLPTLATATKGDVVIAYAGHPKDLTGNLAMRIMVRVDDADERYMFVAGAVFERNGKIKYGRFNHQAYEDHERKGGFRPELMPVSQRDMLAFKARHVLGFLRDFSAGTYSTSTAPIDPRDAKIIEAIFDASGLDAADAMRTQ